MSVVIEKLAQGQEKALELLAGIQQPVIAGVKRTRTVIGEKASALPLAERLPKPKLTLPGVDLPDARELVRNQFGFAEKVLASNKQFALNLVDAVSPKIPEKVTEKVSKTVATAAAAPKKVRAKRAAVKTPAAEAEAPAAEAVEAPAAEAAAD